MAISHVTDKLVAGEESTFGTAPGTFTLNWGDVQSFSYTENNSVEALGAVGSGHTAQRTEAGLYNVTGTLTTRLSKSSIENLAKATVGDVTVTTGDYSVATSTDAPSFTIKAQHNTTEVAVINGLVFTSFSFEASTDGYLVLNADYVAQKLDLSTETITPVLASDDIFSWLDVSGTWRSVDINATSYTISGDWNVSPEEGRGLETITTGTRRLIKRVIRNNLNISADVDYRLDDTFKPLGYEDEPTSGSLVLTASRGTDNEHIFTITNALENENEASNDSEGTVKEGSLNVVGTDLTIAGDSDV